MSIDFIVNLGPDDVVLTPNQRLANILQSALQDHHLSSGNQAFLPPLIISFTHFIRLLWDSYLFISPKKLLTNDEEAWIWRKIVSNSILAERLLNPQQAADLVKKAWHHLKQWRLGLNAIEYDKYNENTNFFISIAQSFQQMCLEKNYIDESSALEAYSENQSFLDGLRYKKIIIYHFIELTPLQETFKKALEKTSITVEILDQQLVNKSITRFEFDNKENEIITLAHWVKENSIEYPNKKIACVFPHLQQERNMIVRTFLQVFKTESLAIDISAGYALSDYPIIQHAFLLSDLCKNEFEYEKFSTFIRSPYFASSEDEMFERARLDYNYRKQVQNKLSLSKTYSFLDRIGDNVCLKTMIQCLLNFCFEEKSLTQWRESWLTLLKSLGWPGQRNLDSTEYQVVARYIKLLDELDRFSVLQAIWSWQEFYSLMSLQCYETIFQPESEKTKIQILGLLEASGQSFDAIWIMGLDDKTWPSASSPNPFLPYDLQKKYHMPNASPEREYLYCKEILKKLIETSTDAIVSSAKYDADKLLQPSALISSITLSTEIYGESCIQSQNLRHGDYEEIEDFLGPSIQRQEKISGGASIIKYQAECPFKSFAITRLHATPFPRPLDAPDALDRGNEIHHCLEMLWKKIQSSKKLHQLSANELEIYIQESIDNVFHHQGNAISFLNNIEKIRLKKHMLDWLNIEKKRHAFNVIAIEDKREYRYKNLILRLRIDRIDQTEDGENIIIDYKTGKTDIKSWIGKRLKEPQLPLYCISQEPMVNAVCFAQLRSNELCFKGITESKLETYANDDNIVILPFNQLNTDFFESTWSEQIITWRNNIHQLLDEFIEGNAYVDPLEPTTCSRCHLKSLCRISENE